MKNVKPTVLLLAASILLSVAHANIKPIRADDPPTDSFTSGSAVSAYPYGFVPQADSVLSPPANWSLYVTSVAASLSGHGIDAEYYQNSDATEDAIDWCLSSCNWGAIGTSGLMGVRGDVLAQLFVQPGPSDDVEADVYFQCGYGFELGTSIVGTTSIALPDVCGSSTTGDANYIVEIAADASSATVSEAVPEPGEAALLLAGLGMLIVTRRARQRTGL
jgi:hypothetical protein